MLTTCIMLLIVAFLGFLILYIDFKGKQSDFFDLENSACMRGFWSIIVMLVHVPTQFQNQIQDMLGSFAYIGVTFFFMTSSYGLMQWIQKNFRNKRWFLEKTPPKVTCSNASGELDQVLFRDCN